MPRAYVVITYSLPFFLHYVVLLTGVEVLAGVGNGVEEAVVADGGRQALVHRPCTQLALHDACIESTTDPYNARLTWCL